MTTRPLFVVGTGSLAGSICDSLAVATGPAPLEVVVVGRSMARAAELCYLAGTRAAVNGSRLTFRPTSCDLDQMSQLEALLRAALPAGVLLCASDQSPWERVSSRSAWTALVEKAGFGVTLPFQADVASRVGRALASTAPDAWFVNACLPDAVNPALAALDIPVLCGVGNVALIVASLQASLALPDERRLAVVAHHAHLHTPPSPGDEAAAWCDGEPVTDVGARLVPLRRADRTQLNRVTGLTAAKLVVDLMVGAERDTHVPGPNGLPGGYPVRLVDGALCLRLPIGLTEAEAVAMNQRAAAHDGVVVSGDEVGFPPAVADELARVAPELADGFPVAELPDANRRLSEVRDRLRTEPDPSTVEDRQCTRTPRP